jgi:hypothetical protein
MTKKPAVLSVALAIALGAFAAGCEAAASGSPITPAPDRPTFLFFYTDG